MPLKFNFKFCSSKWNQVTLPIHLEHWCLQNWNASIFDQKNTCSTCNMSFTNNHCSHGGWQPQKGRKPWTTCGRAERPCGDRCHQQDSVNVQSIMPSCHPLHIEKPKMLQEFLLEDLPTLSATWALLISFHVIVPNSKTLLKNGQFTRYPSEWHRYSGSC